MRDRSDRLSGDWRAVVFQNEFTASPILNYSSKPGTGVRLRLSDVPFLLATKTVALDALKGASVNFHDEQDQHATFRLKSLPLILQSTKGVLESQEVEEFGKWMLEVKHDRFYWHPYNVSERLIHLVWMMSLSGANMPLTCQVMLSAIYMQARYLRDNFEFNLGNHNHLINNVRALLTFSVSFSTSKEAEAWKQYAVDVFNKQWPNQVLDDGVHSEQSTTYHFLLTRTLWEIKQLMQSESIEFLFEDDLKKMIFYAQAITRPDGTIPLIGHITPDWHWRDLVGLLSVWGISNAPMSQLGKLYRQDTQSERTERIDKDILVFPSAGVGIIRLQQIHLVLCCDPRGKVTVHGDQNLLGIDLWYNGTHLIRDTGLASYNLNQERTWFESWKGQSTFSIDGFEPLVNNWRRQQLPESYMKVTGGVVILDGQRALKAYHTGFCRLVDPVRVERLIHEEHGILTIEDCLDCSSSHTYHSKFHFGYNRVELNGNNTLLIFDAVNGNRFEMTWTPNLECILEENPFATEYGHQQIGLSAAFTSAFKGKSTMQYVLKPVY